MQFDKPWRRRFPRWQRWLLLQQKRIDLIAPLHCLIGSLRARQYWRRRCKCRWPSPMLLWPSGLISKRAKVLGCWGHTSRRRWWVMLAGDGNGRRHVGIVLSRGDRLSGCLSLGILLGGEHEVHVELEKRIFIDVTYAPKNWSVACRTTSI